MDFANYNLQRPVIFFDLETTGLKPHLDRIVEIGATKHHLNGTQEELYFLINPTIPIPDEARNVHGYNDEMVKNQPTFADLAQVIFEFFNGCDLAGHNIKGYDMPMLKEELKRCGIEINFDGILTLDTMKISQKVDNHKLETMYTKLFNEKLEKAHTVKSDTAACSRVFFALVEKYGLPQSVESINEMLKSEKNKADDGRNYVDDDRLFERIDNKVYYAKGKHKGIEVILGDMQYLEWVIDKSTFSDNTKQFATQLRELSEETSR